jgi:formylglycine-generating enzyme required for sulfatase activity
MFQELPLPLDWPVYVTQLEAEAYARWAGKSVATEEQFHRAAYGANTRGHREYPWGNAAPAFERGNFDFKRWDPESAYSAQAGESAFGVRQLVGNGWEWTSTPFGPFPGFKARASYPGYSANFFDGGHYVMKGGSARTAARLLRGSFRNWFRGDYPHMYAKFRCVEN